MVNKLRIIAYNFIKAAALLEKTPVTHTGIQNVVSENNYQINQLEIYSDSLAENISFTSGVKYEPSDVKISTIFKPDVENLKKVLTEEFLTPTNRIAIRELIEKLNKL